MNGDDIRKKMDEAGAWMKAHPEAVRALAYIGLGIVLGWFLFY